jgi:translation initiation factor IF-2
MKGLPMAENDITVVGSEERARMLSQGRRKKLERERLERMSQVNWKLGAGEGDEADKVPQRVELEVIVKGDVQGTVQAVADSLRSLNSPQVILEFLFPLKKNKKSSFVLCFHIYC